MRPLYTLTVRVVSLGLLGILSSCAPQVEWAAWCWTADTDGDGRRDDAESTLPSLFYLDADGDGFGGDATVEACSPPAGYAARDGDCDDDDPTSHPDAEEVCDGVDNDCDGELDPDDAPGGPTWYPDSDGDGYGTAAGAVEACAQPNGHVENADDCADADDATYPGADETCDGTDNDCDDATDEEAIDATLWYIDYDGDGHGSPDLAYAESACSQPSGYTASDTDCDDSESAVHPDADEVCDGLDNDCDGEVYGCRGSLSENGLKITGESAGDYVGQSVAGVGDVDGDGFDDLLIGAPEESSGGGGSGAVYLLSGPLLSTPSLNEATAKRSGLAGDDYAGWAVVGAGDVDADGYADLLVGAWGRDTEHAEAGAAYLLLGPVTGEDDLSSADAEWIGGAAQSYAGAAVAGAGDVDGDGYDDVLIGGYNDGDHGAAWLVYGPSSGEHALSDTGVKISGVDADADAGFAVAGAGDVDGDGLADLLVGAPSDSSSSGSTGAAYLLLGEVSQATSLSDADLKLQGEVAGEGAGCAVAGAGDVDGDGLTDLFVGARWDDSGGFQAGAAYLVVNAASASGEQALAEADAKILGEGGGHQAGAAVAIIEDADEDGFDDLLIGAPRNTALGPNTGAAYLILGLVTGTVSLADADAAFIGEGEDYYAGDAVSWGDLDGDGLTDLIVGGYGDRSAGLSAGAVYVILGDLF